MTREGRGGGKRWPIRQRRTASRPTRRPHSTSTTEPQHEPNQVFGTPQRLVAGALSQRPPATTPEGLDPRPSRVRRRAERAPAAIRPAQGPETSIRALAPLIPGWPNPSPGELPVPLRSPTSWDLTVPRLLIDDHRSASATAATRLLRQNLSCLRPDDLPVPVAPLVEIGVPGLEGESLPEDDDVNVRPVANDRRLAIQADVDR